MAFSLLLGGFYYSGRMAKLARWWVRDRFIITNPGSDEPRIILRIDELVASDPCIISVMGMNEPDAPDSQLWNCTRSLAHQRPRK